DQVRVEDLVADRDAEGDEALEDSRGGAGGEIARAFARRRLGWGSGERSGLGEEHEALLVVVAAALAAGPKEARAVERVAVRVARRAEEQVRPVPGGEPGELPRNEGLVLEVERERILRPDDQGRPAFRRQCLGGADVRHELLLRVGARPVERRRNARLHAGDGLRSEATR